MPTLYVCQSCKLGPDTYSSIQEAINAGNHGTEIEVAEGNYNECIKIEKHRGGLVFRRVADGKAIMSIKGAGPEKTFITPPFTGIFASKGDPLLTVGSDVALSLRDLTIKGGSVNGGICNNGRLYLNNVHIISNKANNGGGINSSGTLTLDSGTSVRDNYAAFKGGGIYNFGGHVHLNGGYIFGNSVHNVMGLGGGIYNEGGRIDANGIEITHNQAYRGGGIFNHTVNTVVGLYEAILNIRKFTMSSNSAVLGGGIFNKKGKVNFYGGSISSNSAAKGAGIFNYNGWITLDGGRIESNQAQEIGGGIAIGRDKNYHEVENGNKIGNPQIILKSGEITLNRAYRDGGGIAAPELGPGNTDYIGGYSTAIVHKNKPNDKSSDLENEQFLDDYE